MNEALSCIEDKLRLLLEEAKESRQAAVAGRSSPDEGFVVGRAEALTEVLHAQLEVRDYFSVLPTESAASAEEAAADVT